ncbi:hypothetical protein D3C74_501410 [compost metagenome]
MSREVPLSAHQNAMTVKSPLECHLTIIGAKASPDLDCFGQLATVEPPTTKRRVILAQHNA